MVTHDTTLKCIADRVVYIRDGRVSREEVIQDHVKLEARQHYLAREVEAEATMMRQSLHELQLKSKPRAQSEVR